MTRFRASSRAHCSVCEHRLTVKELDHFLSMADESLHSEILCRDCMEALLPLCRECSSRYTAEGLCEGCGGRAYGVAV
ncbi:hypothetical protein EHM92_02515 [bacterium]|nr:MAG: hypothetical protein EHM92_02515 [bacterium]